MAFIQRFEDIQGWQEARKLTQDIYRISSIGQFAKDYGLRDQIRRAAVSAITNIAEGCDCDSKLEFARFLGIACRSTVEVQSLLYVALDVGYLSEAEFHQQYAQAAKTKGLIGALKHSLRPKPTRTISTQRRPPHALCDTRHLTPDTRHSVLDTRHLTLAPRYLTLRHLTLDT